MQSIRLDRRLYGCCHGYSHHPMSVRTSDSVYPNITGSISSYDNGKLQSMGLRCSRQWLLSSLGDGSKRGI